MNLPNWITTFRLAISIVIFYLIANGDSLQLDIALGLMILAGISDFLDGYIARKHHLITAFGRIADPFADKFLVLGCFLFLMKRNMAGADHNLYLCDLGVTAVFLIMAREFLVSSIRGYIESQGEAFGAEYPGKFKATWQFCAIGVFLFYMAHGGELSEDGLTWTPHHEHLHYLGKFATWSTVIVTLASAGPYIKKVSGKFNK
jgi:CDP-diacylglycerol--glycerol-3-phosphate 3-phosphatidyltransferase